jgi:polyferredoxin
MRIVTARRISQGFFLLLFLWFCVVTTLGIHWWQLRGWPVNWLLQLDPLIGLGTLLTTRSLYGGLLWGVVTLVLTILLGRFFCGWVCPFGSIHQMVGYVGRRNKSFQEKVRLNRYHRGQAIKYWVLAFLLTAAMVELSGTITSNLSRGAWILWILIFGAGAILIVLAAGKAASGSKTTPRFVVILLGVWLGMSLFLPAGSASLQIGLLDPISLVYRSINLSMLPLIEIPTINAPRVYEGVWLIGAVFLTAILLNLKIPRFYCRFICPLGAFFGVISRFALWRVGKKRAEKLECRVCERNCEGACQPSSQIRVC